MINEELKNKIANHILKILSESEDDKEIFLKAVIESLCPHMIGLKHEGCNKYDNCIQCLENAIEEEYY